MDQKRIMTVLRRAGLRLAHKSKYAKLYAQLHAQVDNNISYQTLPSNEKTGRNAQLQQTPEIIRHKDGAQMTRYKDCSPPEVVSKTKPDGKDIPPTPINNFPAYASYDDGVPDAVTLEVFALRRRNVELTTKVEGLNNKLTRALECFQSLRRFFRLWIYEGQGESYDEITGRMKRIDAMIDLIEDRNAGPSPIIEIPQRWQKNKKL